MQAFANVNEVFQNQDLQNLVGTAFSSGQFQAASAAFDQAFTSVKEACKVAFDFIKFDIFTNFFQQIGLWLNSLGFPQFFENVFQKVMSFVSLLWAYISSITELQMFYIWGILSTLLFTIWLIQKKFDPEIEIKGPNTFGWQQRGTIWCLWTRGIVTCLTFLYLPAMTSAFNVLLCSKNLMVPYELTCYEGIHWAHMAAAFFLFIYIGIVLPGIIYQTINKYQPKPQMFDESGEPIDIEFHREEFLTLYRQLLNRDKCPYNFLYCGYEYGKSAYKVVTLVVKMLLVIPVNPLINSEITSVSISLVIVAVYALMSTISKPFILDQDDWIDICARVTAVLTLILQILVVCKVVSEDISSIVLVVLNIVNIVVMILIFVGNMDIVKNFFRRHFGELKFSRGRIYDFHTERKRRIWQRFWRGLLNTYGSLQPVNKRLQEMEDVVMYEGRDAYKNALYPASPDIAQARRFAREIEGVDVYYESDSENFFWGRMYINPFPFKCYVISDETDESVKIDDSTIVEFVKMNQRKEIQNSRWMRQALRVLSGKRVKYQYSETRRMRHGCLSEEVIVNYEYGTLYVKTKANDPFCHGFKVTIEYDDGTATFSDGYTKGGIKTVIGHKEIGINERFTPTPEITRLLKEPENVTFYSGEYWEDFIQRCKFYRDDLEEERQEHENIASWGFWELVFDNDYIPLNELKEYLNKFEPNPELKNVPTLYEDEFNALFSRLKYFDSHPAVQHWYCWFDDIAVKNSVLKKIEQHPDLFDLSNASCLAYHPMPINELKEILERNGLRTKRGTGLFNNKLLNEFEDRLNKLGVQSYDMKQPSYVKPPQNIEMFDPRCTSTPLITENCTFIATAAMNAWSSL
ncbi:hypothetical protein GPJ56_003506 [Histomonas meleagridis]|uniref:uncharacterized protein n=1 Tax=Histomonas meleagridis TaxID=135588 RepID=UPI00355984C1|nr:hypothetical protein GPJ56_003506 [Histomonas meleagridis]KAH0799198.1 hypothetical protein GO595_007995 [Histomonas meleagridis]